MKNVKVVKTDVLIIGAGAALTSVYPGNGTIESP